ncbi:MAG TPA: hypothetical protein VGG72_28875 [Bryobacteraceae bacterium]
MNRHIVTTSVIRMLNSGAIAAMMMIFAASPSSAQQSGAMSIVHDIKLAGPTEAVSPDGGSLVYFKPGSGLLIRTVDNGSEHLLLKNIGKQIPLDAFENIVFSPDGKKLFFTAGVMGRGYARAIYSINLDGSGLTQLAPGTSGPPTKVGNTQQYDYDYDGLAISPDGSRLAVGIMTTEGKADKDGIPSHSGDGHYIAIVPTAVTRQNPEKVVTGYSPIWSIDGTALLYHTKQDGEERLNLQTKQSEPVTLQGKVLGRIDDTGNALVVNHIAGAESLAIQSIDSDVSGTGTKQLSEQAIASIPLTDATTKDRLQAVQYGSRNQLWLFYRGSGTSHVQLVNFQGE